MESGGISFFSGRHGWALDSVKNYQVRYLLRLLYCSIGSCYRQVVLANGQIHNVNRKSNPDLYFALHGAGNNFAIVTRFDLETFPQGLMWGGLILHPSTTNASIYNAFENLAQRRHCKLGHRLACHIHLFQLRQQLRICPAHPFPTCL